MPYRWCPYQKPGKETTWSHTQSEPPRPRHVPVACPCLISSVVRSMSTYKDQTTQVMAMTWNVTEHMIFLRSLAVICSFSHCRDNTRTGSDSVQAEGVRALEMGELPLPPNYLNTPQYPKSFSLSHLALIRHPVLVFCQRTTPCAMARGWHRDELGATPCSRLLILPADQTAVLGQRVSGSSPNQHRLLAQTQAAHCKSPWRADQHGRGKQRVMTPQHTTMGNTTWEGDAGGAASAPLLLWQQQRESTLRAPGTRSLCQSHLL